MSNLQHLAEEWRQIAKAEYAKADERYHEGDHPMAAVLGCGATAYTRCADDLEKVLQPPTVDSVDIMYGNHTFRDLGTTAEALAWLASAPDEKFHGAEMMTRNRSDHLHLNGGEKYPEYRQRVIAWLKSQPPGPGGGEET